MTLEISLNFKNIKIS